MIWVCLNMLIICTLQLEKSIWRTMYLGYPSLRQTHIPRETYGQGARIVLYMNFHRINRMESSSSSMATYQWCPKNMLFFWVGECIGLEQPCFGRSQSKKHQTYPVVSRIIEKTQWFPVQTMIIRDWLIQAASHACWRGVTSPGSIAAKHGTNAGPWSNGTISEAQNYSTQHITGTTTAAAATTTTTTSAQFLHELEYFGYIWKGHWVVVVKHEMCHFMTAWISDTQTIRIAHEACEAKIIPK